jgi:hypothetical protein
MIVNREKKNPKKFNNKMKKILEIINYCSKESGYEVYLQKIYFCNLTTYRENFRCHYRRIKNHKFNKVL